MIAIETLYLTALLSAFIGMIALFVLIGPVAGQTARFRRFMGNLVILATVVSISSFFIYAVSPHTAARSVYGAMASRGL